MEMTGAAQGDAPDRFVVTEAERQVADLLPIEVDPALARATVERVIAPSPRTPATGDRPREPTGSTLRPPAIGKAPNR